MSDLSWLNPTPHAIAVYASSPLSPAATQHSLPSGRYPLLGPDLHRLDRTSLRLAHSLDHLIRGDKQRVGHGEAECLGGFEVEARFVFGRRLHRQIGRLLALEDAIDIAGIFESLAECAQTVRVVVRRAALSTRRLKPWPMRRSRTSRPCIIGYGSSPSRCGPATAAPFRSDPRSPSFRCDPFARDAALDPGRA